MYVKKSNRHVSSLRLAQIQAPHLGIDVWVVPLADHLGVIFWPVFHVEARQDVVTNATSRALFVHIRRRHPVLGDAVDGVGPPCGGWRIAAVADDDGWLPLRQAQRAASGKVAGDPAQEAAVRLQCPRRARCLLLL